MEYGTNEIYLNIFSNVRRTPISQSGDINFSFFALLVSINQYNLELILILLHLIQFS